jgi:hypothetical protein
VEVALLERHPDFERTFRGDHGLDVIGGSDLPGH